MLRGIKKALVALLFTSMILSLTGCAGIFGGVMGAVVDATKKKDNNSCFAPGGTTGTMSGSENLQRSFNFLVSAGYSKEMAAGIAGNLQTESAGATPWLAEYGYASQWGWGVPDNQLRGWGIVQWTWARHAHVRDYVVGKIGKQYYTSQYSNPVAKDWMKPEDEAKLLQAELEFLLQEMQDPYYKSRVYDPMMKASTPEQAADIFVRNFEIPQDVDSQSVIRQQQARALYDKFKNGAPSGGSAPITGALTDGTPSADTSNGGGGSQQTGTMKFHFPLDPGQTMTSPFGMRLHPVLNEWRLHTGIDLAGGPKTLYAMADGQITFAGDQVGYGNFIVLRMANGDYARYAHAASISVTAGQNVKAGDPIGIEGSTGYSTGDHLHFEIIPKANVNDPKMGVLDPFAPNTVIDPAPWLDAHGFNLDGTPNGKVPSDQYADSPNLNSGCAPSNGTTGGANTSPGADMHPGPLPAFDANALANAPQVHTDNETPDTARKNGYLRQVWGPLGISEKDIFDYPSSLPSCHGPGEALDIMVPENSVLGDTVAAWIVAHNKELGVSILIWKQQIWTAENPTWRPMEDRGSITQNHRDHNHVSFYPCFG